MIGKVFTQLLGLIALVFVLRKIDVDIFGTFSFLITTFLFFNIFGLSPFVATIRRYIPEMLSQSDFRGIRKFVAWTVIFSFAVFLILSIIFYIFRNELGDFFNIPSLPQYIVLTMIYLLFHYYERIFKNLTQSLLLNRLLSKANIFASFVKTMLYFIFLPRLDINLLLKIEIIHNIIIFFLIILFISDYLRKNIKNTIKKDTTAFDFRRVFRHAFFSSLSEFGQGALGRSSDIFIVSAISNPVQLGLYSFGNRIYSIVSRIVPAKELMSVIRPMFIKKFTAGYQTDEFQKIYNFIIKFLLPVYVTPALYFLVFGENVIQYVFDEKYMDAYFVTFILLFSQVFHGMFISQGITIELMEKMEIKFYTQAITFVSIFIGIYAMYVFGINGLAVATTIGLSSKYIVMQILLRRHVRISYDWIAYFKYFIIYSILTVVFFAANQLVTGILTLAIASILYCLTLILLIFRINPFSSYDRELLTKISENSKVFSNVSIVIKKGIRLNRPLI